MDVALRERVKAKPLLGPRVFASGPGITVGVGQFPSGTAKAVVADEYEVIERADQAKGVIARYKKAGVDLIKVFVDNDPNPADMPTDILEALVREAHATNLRVAAHAVNDTSAMKAAKAGVDSIEHGYTLSGETLKFMRERGIALVPNDIDRETCAVVSIENSEAEFKSCDEYRRLRGLRLRAARDAGVLIGFGSDMYLDIKPPMQNRGAVTIGGMIAYVEEGFSPIEALRTATKNAARILGRKDLGVILPGAEADLVVFEGNPLREIRDLKRVHFVMKAGEPIKSAPAEKP